MQQQPFAHALNVDVDELRRLANPRCHRLSDVAACFEDRPAVESVLLTDDPIVYETYSLVEAGPAEDLLCDFTVLMPGKVGNEFYMTRGHFNRSPARSELCVGIAGTGLLLMQTREGNVATSEITPGAWVYVPAPWAHRAVNCGTTTLVFVSFCAADTGHDYNTIGPEGFLARVRDTDGRPRVDLLRAGGERNWKRRAVTGR